MNKKKQLAQKNSWLRGKMKGLVGEVFIAVFSFGFLKAIFSSFAYYLHEHVLWRKYLNTQGPVRIHSRTSIRNAQNICLGENVRITMDCCIWAEKNSRITMGRDVLIGPGVKMFCGNHGTAKNGVPMVFQERAEQDICIGDDVWIGANSVILSGVTVKNGAVVAAGSVVTKDVPEFAVVAGIPAKVIRFRE